MVVLRSLGFQLVPFKLHRFRKQHLLDKKLAELSSQQVAYHHLLTIPGVGPLIAAAVVSEVDATQFSSGRELSAWCGLVPRQHSSGGKQRLSSMTKNGNRNLRTL